jgi:hypothetical protein
VDDELRYDIALSLEPGYKAQRKPIEKLEVIDSILTNYILLKSPGLQVETLEPFEFVHPPLNATQGR